MAPGYSELIFDSLTSEQSLIEIVLDHAHLRHEVRKVRKRHEPASRKHELRRLRFNRDQLFNILSRDETALHRISDFVEDEHIDGRASIGGGERLVRLFEYLVRTLLWGPSIRLLDREAQFFRCIVFRAMQFLCELKHEDIEPETHRAHGKSERRRCFSLAVPGVDLHLSARKSCHIAPFAGPVDYRLAHRVSYSTSLPPIFGVSAYMEMDDNKRRRNMIVYVLIAFVVYLVLSTTLFPNLGHTQQIVETDYSSLITALKKKNVKSVQYNTDDYTIYYTKKGESDDIAYKTTGVPNDSGFTDRVLASGASLESVVPDKNSGFMQYYLFTLVLPMVIFFLIGWWLNRRMKKAMGDDGPSMNFGGGGFGGGGLGKSGARVIASKDVGVTFKDVAGQEEAKESLKEVVDFLEKPQRYEEIGAKLPRGVLLVGPPGTGKTLLAKAVAGEAGVPFFSISGSEFVEMFVGRGAAKVRDLFKQAKEKAPCIVFIDEVDTIGKKRDGGGFSGNDEREQTLNQLLTEMDGFDNHKGIVVLAATNRPDSLDPALLRPGRFDRRVPVELPDLAGRKSILELHAKGVKTQPPIDLSAIARATPGASGADLANIINEGALRAVREGRKRATQDDFEESVEVVIAGQQRKSTVLSDHEKQVVSYHEIGHAIVAARQKGSAPVTKITIVPRTSGALGYTMQVEEDERFLTTKQEVLDKLAVYCGGRAAEELIFGEMTTGAANDIEQATKLARNMVTRFGMSDEFGMMALGTVQNQYLNQDTSLTCAPGTAEEVDKIVAKLIEDAHARAMQVLKENKFKLHELARYLYRKETITGDEFMKLLTRENPLMPKQQ